MIIVKYIMVTHWDRHWDNLRDNSASFTLSMIKDGISKPPFPTKADTLFIKLNKDKEFEKSWLGISKDFREAQNNGKPAIKFEVADLREILCPSYFKRYHEGWHLNSANIPIENNLEPAFFKEMEMESCSSEIFEQDCFHLLRLIGIHDIHALPRQLQQGKPDGFFKFYNLAVIYDATLRSNSLSIKDQQIENYIHQLKKEEVNFNSKRYTFNNAQRQVWIITRGEVVKLLKTVDHIKVKEVPYKKLISIYNRRLNEEIDTAELCDILKDLK